ncbi:ABC transporter substrate-binding protein [Oceaniglobus trochenteri]|uniref:ABC transporter substrate-binding protein n=1 Tax=Oceaniglobus trochenteri TaxID=2763260 RepID=UPI001D000AAC|nr:ABC transporter substrate-binding protein [Oceaniglobus trochenteri]
MLSIRSRGPISRTALALPLGLLALAAAPAAAQDTLVVDANFQLKTADPARAFEPTASLVLHPVYETLVTFEGSDVTQVVPLLANVPEISQDVKTFTFTLNDGATFSDGSPVEVSDVVFSLERARDLKGSPSYLMRGVSVAAGDAPGTIVLTTEAPDPALPFKLTNLALSILNADVLKENGGTATPEDGAERFLSETSVGSGPYVLTKFDTSSEVILESNGAYWGDAPVYDRIVVRNVNSNAQQMNVARGASQVALNLRPDQVGSIEDRVNVFSGPAADMGFMFLNGNPEVSELSTNADLREAVRYGIDYQGIIDFIGEGAVQPAGIIPTMIEGSLPTDQRPTRDVERAKAALGRSGLNNPTLTISYAADLAKYGIAFADIAAKVQADLAEIGINVELNPESVQANLDNYRGGTLEMSVQWWGGTPHPSNSLPFTSGKLVGLRAGWAEGGSPELEELASKAEVASVADERIALYREWQTKLNEVGPFIPLFQPPVTLVGTKDIEPLEYNPMWTVDLSDVRPAQ